MAKRSSPSRIKTHSIYTPAEAADVLGVHKQTVRRWISHHGLPADKTQRPWLIDGADLKAFLGHRKQNHRRKPELHQCFCVGCKEPRDPYGKLADYVHQTPTSGMLTALCPSCGCLMHKVIARSSLETIRAKIEVTIQRADPRLVSHEDTPSNTAFEQEPECDVKTQSK